MKIDWTLIIVIILATALVGGGAWYARGVYDRKALEADSVRTTERPDSLALSLQLRLDELAARSDSTEVNLGGMTSERDRAVALYRELLKKIGLGGTVAIPVAGFDTTAQADLFIYTETQIAGLLAIDTIVQVSVRAAGEYVFPPVGRFRNVNFEIGKVWLPSKRYETVRTIVTDGPIYDPIAWRFGVLAGASAGRAGVSPYGMISGLSMFDRLRFGVGADKWSAGIAGSWSFLLGFSAGAKYRLISFRDEADRWVLTIGYAF